MRRVLILAFATASLVAVIAAPLVSGDGARRFEARLEGFSEVPAVSTTGRGSFTARLEGETMRFTLSYRDLSAVPTMAHIHFAQPDVNGGISVWLCGTVPPTANATQPATCPNATSGQVTAVVGPANVVGPAAQGITSGEWGELLRAMRGGVTYANIHTSNFPGGEIRGRIVRSDDD